MAHSDIELLMCTFVDNAGITRVKTVPANRISAVSTSGIGISPSLSVMCVDDYVTATDNFGGPVGDLRLLPDMSASSVIDPDVGLAWAPLNQYTQDMQRFPLCQRGVLERQVDAGAELGLDFLVAFEVEFTLFSGDSFTPAHRGPGYGIIPLLQLEDFSLALVSALRTANVELETLHPEYGPGQMEISLAPRSPVAAVDQYLLARLIITRTAYQHGMDVSFAPITIQDEIGNGCHLHFSASMDGHNVFTGGDGIYELTPTATQLLAGVLSHLREATGVLAPGIASYERLQPGLWSGAYACWGLENREAAVRLIPGSLTSRAQSANVEIKSIDATSNPYLVVAAILGAALTGVKNQSALMDPVNVDPDTIPAAERQARNIERLPQTLSEALDLLEQSATFRDILGDDLVDCLVAVRRYEDETYGSSPLEDRIALVRARY